METLSMIEDTIYCRLKPINGHRWYTYYRSKGKLNTIHTGIRESSMTYDMHAKHSKHMIHSST